MYPVKQSTSLTVPFFVHDSSGDAVTGLADGTFTKRISKGSGAFGAMTVTITEMENGWYSIPLSTSHSDTVGVLSITFTNAGAEQVNLQYRVHANIPDDLATDLSNIETDTQDIQSRLPAALVSGRMSSDVVAVSGDTTAADNLESQYDETGLTGDTFPAPQSQVGNIASGTAAINTTTDAAPNGFVLTTGLSEAADEDSTHELDGATHDLEDNGGTTDAYYIFDVGSNGVPVSVTWEGYAQSNGDSYGVYAYNFTTPAWEQIGTVTAANGTTTQSHTFNLTNAHVGTSGADLNKVRFRYQSTDGTKFATDRVLCSYTVVARSVGYADGAIWVDSAGTSGTENYVNGTADNPCPWANALTISASLGIKRFAIATGNTVTLSANSDAYTLVGSTWTLALGGQSIEGSSFEGADVTGIGTATVTRPVFRGCHVGAATLPPAIFEDSGIGLASGQFTAGSDGQYVFHKCYSLVPGSGSPALVFSGLGAATGINNRGWNGGATYTLDSDCTLSHEVSEGGGTTVTTGGGDVEIRGITRSLTVTMSAAETVQFVGVTGPIGLSGTTTATVNLYGVASVVTDTTSAATVTDKTVSRANINTEADTALSDYDPPTKAEMDTAHGLLATEAKQDTMQGNVTDILADTNELQTDDIPGAIAALNDPTAAAIAAAVLASTAEAEGTYTVQQILSIVLSACAGVTSAGGATLKTPDGVATRIAATVNGSNERTAMTLTPSA